AVDCNTVKSDLVGCVGYLPSGTGNPTPQCCDGVVKL
nr:RecName: Full=Probable non-specific lipid-transfer protein; Short=Basic protein; Short=LTP; Short=PBP [Pinus pinea]AAB22133.1 basic protein, PBP=calcium-dependent protein kinase substrate [Pinus pinea L.=pine, Peptide Partial, 36 aa] [Pinus pinea]